MSRITDSTRITIQIGGFLITIIGLIVSGSLKAARIDSRVKACEVEIKRVDVDGCKPSVLVRRDMAAMQNQGVNNKATLDRIESELREIKTIVMKQVRQ